ncbi:MAG: hypothetical protein QW835_00170 [Candidatus Hadarchaeum sp.]
MKYGLNHFNVKSELFSTTTHGGKIWIGRIEAGSTLNSVGLKIIDPPMLGKIPISLAVGIFRDDDFFVPWFTPSNSVEKIEEIWNGGEFFKCKSFFSSDINVYLSYVSFESRFSVGPSILKSDTGGGGAGDGYSATYCHGTDVGTEFFNNLAWSYSVDVPRRVVLGHAVGWANSLLLFAGASNTWGVDPNGPLITAAQFFNGSAWTQFPDHPYPTMRHSGVGTANNVLSIGGHGITDILKNTARFNGISWWQGPVLNTQRFSNMSFGSPEGAVTAGGNSAWHSPNSLSSCEEFNGVSWFFIASLLYVSEAGGGFGSTASCGLVAMGLRNVNGNISYLTVSQVYRSPVWLIGCSLSSQSRVDVDEVGDERVGMLIAGHTDSGSSSNVDLLRPERGDATGNVELYFVLS